jgi:RNA polymerase-associated protein CTR9
MHPRIYVGHDKLTNEKPKDEYYKEATACINDSGRALGASESDGGALTYLTRGEVQDCCSLLDQLMWRNPVGVHYLAIRNMDEALRAFDSVLALKPTNLVALLGKVRSLLLYLLRSLRDVFIKARIFYARRQFHPALKLFQEVLRLNPNCQPDPRIGIGLCLWALDHKGKAKAAWKRSLEVVCFLSSRQVSTY